MEVKISIPASQIPKKGIEYKYTIMRKEKDKEKFDWELYVKNTHTGILSDVNANRTLIIQDKWKNSGRLGHCTASDNVIMKDHNFYHPLVFYSHEHPMLMVRFCDRPMSVVRCQLSS